MFVKNFLSLTLVSVFSVGCASWVESAKKMIDKDTARAKTEQSKEVKWVSKSQYDDLLVKYKNLSDKHNQILEAPSKKPMDKFDQLDELSKNVSQSETIDVFESENIRPANKVIVPVSQSSSTLKKQLSVYKKAILLKANGKLKESLSIFQKLERGTIEQVAVRSKFEIAHIYLSQNQFDLSLQVFESIINEHAFSSRVVGALKGAIESSDKLQLADKKTKYSSILQDIFGIKG